ncbi:metallophosphoesterase [Flavobacteriaceae bacterium]|nr:metallophosphoesterase [Flavobacteriaceae bacterium]
MNRKNFLKKSLLGSIGLGMMSSVYAWKIEPYWLEFVNVKMPIKNLPNHLIGKTLIQISDIHIGNRFDYEYIISSFKETQLLQPDFVVYTGDFVSYENHKQIDQLKNVFKNVVKGRLGTFGVLGNHDYGDNWEDVVVSNSITKVLENNGVTMLRNESTICNGLNFIGFEDYWSPNFNPKPVMKNLNSDEANIVLCHNPDVCDLGVWYNYKGWILSGHTHGGQCKPPFLPAPILPVKNKNYSSGKISLSNGRTLYINRALGCLWPIRFNVRPEITIFKLEKENE